MGSKKTLKRPFEKVYSSIPSHVKDAIREEADRRGLQISDIIRELLMEKYGGHPRESASSPRSSWRSSKDGSA